MNSRPKLLSSALILSALALTSSFARAEGAEPSKVPGLYGGLTLGMGQPLGGTTVSGNSAAVDGGVGGAAHVGYAFHPNFGLNAFFNYNYAHLAFGERGEPTPDSSGHIMLYGVEARGFLTTERTVSWLSAGIAMGTGKVTTTYDRGGGYASEDTLSVDVTVSPELAFGTELRLTPNLALGPQFRWFVTGFDNACGKYKSSGPSTGGAPTTYSGERCASSTSKEVVPHIGFVGLGLTYYGY